MSYRGRYQLGSFLPLTLLCRNSSYTPVVPDDVPRVNIWDASGAKVLCQDMPVLDRYNQTGLFQLQVRIDSTFTTTGIYTAEYQFTLSGSGKIHLDTFEIIPGGNANGSIISIFDYTRPQAKYLVNQADSGTISLSRNPSF